MKTTISSVFLLFFLLFSFGCRRAVVGPSGSVKCQNKTEDYSAAVSAFVANPTSGTCNSVKNTLKDLVKSCTGTLGVATAAYENIDCTQF